MRTWGMRQAAVLAGLAIVLIAVNWSIAGKERLLREGETMLLELAPVDPRSLIQGDYMRLDYAIARQLTSQAAWPRDGRIVVALDGNGVARFVRRLEPGATPAADERLLRYRRRSGQIRLATDAFHFQEGHAERYSRAKYGELRVDADGDAVLVGLRDAERRPLGSDTRPSAP